MWMMGYNDGGELLNNNINIQDSFNGRRLRQLMPRPPTTSTTLIHAGTHDLLALNHHFEEQNKRVLNNNNNNNTQQIVVSSRWNPTPEQLQTLEELYRRGTRTPSAEQIQLITSQLRRYGKIEGKNVFYWFQNHKARERQKRRRQLHQPSPLSQNHDGEKNKDDSSLTGANRSVYEVEQTKNWASPTNSSTIATEKQGGRGAPTECKGADDGWLQFDYNNNNNNNNNINEEEEAAIAAAEEEVTTILQQQQQQRKNATWQQMMHLSCSSSSSPAPIQSTTMVKPKDKHLSEPYNSSNGRGGGEEAAAATQTLQLFPLLGDGDGDEKDNASTTMMDSPTNHQLNVTPYPFFEFLPLKN